MLLKSWLAFLVFLLISASAVYSRAATLTLNQTAFQPNAPIVATFSAGPGNPSDWIGIYPQGIIPSGSPSSLLWRYTNGTMSVGGTVKNGSVTFGSPQLPEGQYSAWFLANDGYAVLAGPVNFSVKATTTVQEPAAAPRTDQSQGAFSAANGGKPAGPVTHDVILGQWTGTLKSGNGTVAGSNFLFRKEKDSSRVNAVWTSDFMKSETLLRFVLVFPSGEIQMRDVIDGTPVVFTGKVDASRTSMGGTFLIDDPAGNLAGTWTATNMPPGKPTALQPTPAAAAHPGLDSPRTTSTDVTSHNSGKSAVSTVPRVLFFDEFDDNRAGWNLADTAGFTYAIPPGGQLVAEGRGNYGYSVELPHAKAPRIDQNLDFLIETAFVQHTGDPAHPIGILWGRKDGTSSFYFGIFATGRYNYGRNTPAGWFQLVNGDSAAVNRGLNVKNKIAIRKRGPTLEFYINDTLVGSTPYLHYSEPSPTIGVTFNHPKRVSFDYIKVMN